MEKKQYEPPKMSVIEIEVCHILATSFNIDKGSQGDFKEDFVRGHRVTWGNLWNRKDRE